MAKKKNPAPAPASAKKSVMAVWIACGAMLVVLSFFFGMMVGDGGPNSATTPSGLSSTSQQALSTLSGMPASATPLSADQVPAHLRDAASRVPGTGTRAPVVAPPMIDLGTVKQNAPTPAVVELQNTSDKPVTIRSTRADCGCTTVDMAGTVIPPGRSVPLEATFQTATLGPRSSTIHVVFEDYDEPMQIRLSATVQE